MDDLAIGRLLRELRIRLGWTQRVIAAKTGVSTAAYSEIERGLIDTVPLGKLRRVAATLDVRLVLEPRWRGAAVDRVLATRHASMTEAVVRLLLAAGWQVQPEVSFSHYGERGVVDIVAWHAPTGTLLLVELKTELVDLNGLLATTDRRRRLAGVIAAPFDWTPRRVAQWVVVAESKTNRRRLGAHRVAYRAAFPDDGRAVAGWLHRPDRGLSALWFLPDSAGSSERGRRAPTLRVSRARSRSGRRRDTA